MPTVTAGTASVRVGLGLSGGGFRAALFHIGALARLAGLDLLRHVQVISTVSGGSIIGALYYLHLRQLLRRTADADIRQQDYVAIVERIQHEFPLAIRQNLRMRTFADIGNNARMYRRDYSRSDRMGELYEEVFYRPQVEAAALFEGRVVLPLHHPAARRAGRLSSVRRGRTRRDRQRPAAQQGAGAGRQCDDPEHRPQFPVHRQLAGRAAQPRRPGRPRSQHAAAPRRSAPAMTLETSREIGDYLEEPPAADPAAAPPAGRHAQRWAHVLARFALQPPDRPFATTAARTADRERDLERECRWTPRLRGIADELRSAGPPAGGHEGLIASVGERAEALYRSIWCELTEEERRRHRRRPR